MGFVRDKGAGILVCLGIGVVCFFLGKFSLCLSFILCWPV